MTWGRIPLSRGFVARLVGRFRRTSGYRVMMAARRRVRQAGGTPELTPVEEIINATVGLLFRAAYRPLPPISDIWEADGSIHRALEGRKGRRN